MCCDYNSELLQLILGQHYSPGTPGPQSWDSGFIPATFVRWSREWTQSPRTRGCPRIGYNRTKCQISIPSPSMRQSTIPNHSKTLHYATLCPMPNHFNNCPLPYCLLDWPSSHHLCINCITSINGINIIDINYQLQLSCHPSSHSNLLLFDTKAKSFQQR